MAQNSMDYSLQNDSMSEKRRRRELTTEIASLQKQLYREEMNMEQLEQTVKLLPSERRTTDSWCRWRLETMYDWAVKALSANRLRLNQLREEFQKLESSSDPPANEARRDEAVLY